MHGYLALILTCHVPYVRAAGRHPQGEDALHETIAQAIVPTLNALFDLRDAGQAAPVALAYSPILIDQLGDNVVQKHFVLWMEEWLAARADALARWERQGAAHNSYLARFYLDWGRGILRSFTERYARNLPGAIRDLCAAGAEALAGAATHAYLPLLTRASSLHAQLQVGTLSLTRQLGRRPAGLWLPECGYHPAIAPATQANDTRYLIADPSSTGPAQIPHLRPRWIIPGRLSVFVRDAPAARHVWSPELGYPGDPLYRSTRRDPRSGLELWRTGTPGAPLSLYDPYDAFRRAQEHAAHFIAAVAAELEEFHSRHDRPGIAVVPIDAELLGRRWFEGPMWLRAVLERAAAEPSIRLTTPSAYLRAHRPRQSAQLREGSWGPGGDHRAWASAQARPLRMSLAAAEERLDRLVHAIPNAQGDQERVLNQALRELLLAQSSDWLLLLGQEGGADGLERANRHLERFEQLCQLAEAAEISGRERTFLAEVEELDNSFPYLNYRIFAETSPG